MTQEFLDALDMIGQATGHCRSQQHLTPSTLELGGPSAQFVMGVVATWGIRKRRSSVNPVLSVAWSPDGRSIASGDTSGTVYVWKVADQKIFFTYSRHKGAVNALAWSPDGKTIASASADNTVQVWQPG